jgi:hypothetical protein
MSNNLALSLLVTAAVTSAACTIDVQGDGHGQGVVVREQKRVALTGMPNVTIRTFDGSIQLRPGEGNEIFLDIERQAATAAEAKELVVNVTESGGNVLIEAKRPRRSNDDWIHLGGWSSPSVRMTLTVPRQLNLEVHTGDGAIDVSDLAGRVEVRTGDGPVRLQGVEGEVTVRTGDGSVVVRDVRGSVVVSTGDGSVEMSGRFEGLRARTGDGAISIDALPGSTMRGDWNVSSGDGGVMIRLPPGFNADVDAHTGDGSIATSGVSVTSPPEQEERRNVRGRIGAGGAVLTVRTGDGSIDVVAR